MNIENYIAQVEALNRMAVDGTAINMNKLVPTFKSIIGASILSSNPTAGIGYATGAGGSYTQATSFVTTVTVTTICGRITTSTAATTTNQLLAGEEAEFNVSAAGMNIGASDIPLVVVSTQFTGGGLVQAYIKSVSNNSFVIGMTNYSVTNIITGAGTAIINYAIIQSAQA